MQACMSRAPRARPDRPVAATGRWGHSVGSAAMTDFVFYGDTERSYAMRHELPVVIGDAFVLAIVDGRMHVAVSFLDRSRVREVMPDAVLHDFSDLGFG